MSANEIFDAIQQINRYEAIGMVTGIIGVWLATRQSVLCWPIGLISVTMYVVVFFDAKLYADMGLQVVYIVLSIYGWYEWMRGGKGDTGIEISNLKMKEFSMLTFLGLIFTLSLGYYLENYTDADLPYIDSATTAISLVAQWLMARKVLENWLIWIVVDAAYVVIYVYKDLYLTSFLFFVFLILAIMGFMEWKREKSKALNFA